jgi:hypothetical protein
MQTFTNVDSNHTVSWKIAIYIQVAFFESRRGVWKWKVTWKKIHYILLYCSNFQNGQNYGGPRKAPPCFETPTPSLISSSSGSGSDTGLGPRPPVLKLIALPAARKLQHECRSGEVVAFEFLFALYGCFNAELGHYSPLTYSLLGAVWQTMSTLYKAALYALCERRKEF